MRDVTRDNLTNNTYLTANVSFFGSKKRKKPTKTMLIKDVLNDFQTGKYKQVIEHLRTLSNDEYKEAKQQIELPCVSFSCTLTTRETTIPIQDRVIQHTGILLIDIDNISSALPDIKRKLISDTYTAFCFESPSGKGLKIGILINNSQHLESYFTVEAYYKQTYNITIDKSCKDIPRLCYVSYDPNLYINNNPQMLIADEPRTLQNLQDKYIHVSDKLQNPIHIQSVNKHISTRLHKIITKLIQNISNAESGQRHNVRLNNIQVFGGYCANGYCSKNDYWNEFVRASDSASDKGKTPQGELQTLEDGFKIGLTRPLTIDLQENIITYDSNNFDKIINYDTNDIIEISLPFCFWYEVKSSKGTELKIDPTKLYEVLGRNIKLLPKAGNSGAYDIIHVANNKIHIVNLRHIRGMLKDMIKQLPSYISPNHTRAELNSVILRGIDSYISYSGIDYEIERVNIKPKRDTPDTSYHYFSNCFVEVSRNGIVTKPYSDLTGYIWDSYIHSHSFTIIPDQEAFNSDTSLFMQRVCSERKIAKDGNISITLDNKRYSALQCVIGYLLHTYHSQSYRKAIILTEKNLDNTKADGGSGKTIIAKLVKAVRNLILTDGKEYDQNNRFCNSEITDDTDIFCINDAKSNLDIEKLFAKITDGGTIERKGENKITISEDNAITILIASNYPVRVKDKSSARRIYEMELTQYYNDKHKPRMEFAKDLGTPEWNADEWNMFYNFMFLCQVEYFKNNCVIPDFKSDTIIQRQMTALTSANFFEYAKGLKPGIYYSKDIEYHNLIADFSESEKHTFSKNLFTRWIKMYSEAYGFEYHENRAVEKGTQRKYTAFMLTMKNPDNI